MNTRNTCSGAHSAAWFALVTAVIGAVAVGGCGQRGNLYLPNQQKKSVPATQQQPPSGQSSSGAQ
jgi:predicted small lipoprotein YifL